jgi:mannose-6-phosphate isomerase
VFQLDNRIQPYAWGSFTAIAKLLGRPPSPTPQAELWLGAHPLAPSGLLGTPQTSLEQLIAQRPAQLLGEASVARFGPTLPFLLKVLAAAQPLSLQAHPSLQQAAEGFAKEDAAQVPRTAPTRNYKDANHKPEIICALTPFDALCGFRQRVDSIEFFDALGLGTGLLRRGLREYFEGAMTLPSAARVDLARQAAKACAQRAPPGFERECAWGVKLAQAYPDDVGLVGALLLNLVTLQPGQALFLRAGNLHAYLEGVGIELMANSDNVLRGGLTVKHVDVPELMRVLDFTDGPVQVLEPGGAVAVYETSAPDFELTRLELAAQPLTLARRGAEVLLVTRGTLEVRCGASSLTVTQGGSVFIGADEGPLVLAGAGTAFRATVGR